MKLLGRIVALVVALHMTACAAKRPLNVRPRVTIEFRGIRDGKCTVRDIELDAGTGNQVVICGEGKD